MAKAVDSTRLHKLCHDGNLEKLKTYTRHLTTGELQEHLNNRHEAVSGNKSKVIPYLCEKGANVNGRANCGYTPLHMAASAGHIDCVKVLLTLGADVSLTDDYGKTPKQTAGLNSKSSIVRLLRSEEIVKEVKTNGNKLTELLRVRVDDLEDQCLERALRAAVDNDNHLNVGKLMVKGAINAEECLDTAKADKKHYARAMLLLIKAARENDKDLILKLFGVSRSNHPLTLDDDFPEVQKTVISGQVSTVVPIKIACWHNNPVVREELILRTEVNQEEGSVYWDSLDLLQLELHWFSKIRWVKKLRLARNMLRMIPNEIGGYLQQVEKLDLQYNELTHVPRCIFELPNLNELNLSSNRLKEIPRNVSEWSPGLTKLNLSHNELSDLPFDIVAPICKLDLSHNRFRTVPFCVCFFINLEVLDLSGNPDITALPVEMGQLASIKTVYVKGLQNLSDDIPSNIQMVLRPLFILF